MVMPDGFIPEKENIMPTGIAADGSILAVVAGNTLTILTPVADAGGGTAAVAASASDGLVDAESQPGGATAAGARPAIAISHGAIAADGRRGLRLSFDVASLRGGPGLREIILTPAGGGLRFSGSRAVLARAVAASSAGRRLPLAARMAHGKLIITFSRPVVSARIVITSRAISVARRLARRIERGRRSTVRLGVYAIDGAGAGVPLTATLKAR
jgi:hypothetical protein